MDEARPLINISVDKSERVVVVISEEAKGSAKAVMMILLDLVKALMNPPAEEKSKIIPAKGGIMNFVRRKH